MAHWEFICANWDPGNGDCKKLGKFTCKNCQLVLYCGPTCQKSHWAEHKTDCKSPLSKETWKPAWVVENRRCVSGENGLYCKHKTEERHLFGNTAAIDVLRLESNEGANYHGDLSLFAASGDIRNLVKTIVDLPSSYDRPLKITMNDKSIDVVARNVMMLLVALTAKDETLDEAIDCIIHLWYSALLRKSDLDFLQNRIQPFIADVCEKVASKPSKQILGKTWKFDGNQNSLRVISQKPLGTAFDLAFMSLPG